MLVLGTSLAFGSSAMPPSPPLRFTPVDRAAGPPSAPIVSIVVSTYNRAHLLRGAIERLLAQRTSFPYEVIVVDNNSADHTAAVLQEAARSGAQLFRFGFEPRQGVSYGRNKGIELSHAPIVAFTDDDVLVTPDWAERVVQALTEHPEVDCVGGRVVPVWKTPPPNWLSREHWSPLALVDYGSEPFYVDRRRPVCLVTANVAYRRTALDEIGWFSAEFPRCQDHELLLRLWRAERRGLYLPSLVVTCEVPPERLRWEYHRRWHADHGRFLARMPDESSRAEGLVQATLFGVPAVYYRQLASHVMRWLGSLAAGRRSAARRAEVLARQRASFIASRARQWKQQGDSVFGELLRFCVAWIARRRARRPRQQVPVRTAQQG